MSDSPFANFRNTNGRFVKGHPGGPGRPRGASDPRLAKAGVYLIDAALKYARAGNVKAIELLLNQIWPAPSGLPTEIASRAMPGTADRGPMDRVPVASIVADASPQNDVKSADTRKRPTPGGAQPARRASSSPARRRSETFPSSKTAFHALFALFRRGRDRKNLGKADFSASPPEKSA